MWFNIYNSRAYFISEKCNVPDEIRSRDLSHCKSPLYLLSFDHRISRIVRHRSTSFGRAMGYNARGPGIESHRWHWFCRRQIMPYCFIYIGETKKGSEHTYVWPQIRNKKNNLLPLAFQEVYHHIRQFDHFNLSMNVRIVEKINHNSN
jgi:hypothetical protein